jgi:hypothetical protein
MVVGKVELEMLVGWGLISQWEGLGGNVTGQLGECVMLAWEKPWPGLLGEWGRETRQTRQTR